MLAQRIDGGVAQMMYHICIIKLKYIVPVNPIFRARFQPKVLHPIDTAILLVFFIMLLHNLNSKERNKRFQICLKWEDIISIMVKCHNDDIK